MDYPIFDFRYITEDRVLQKTMELVILASSINHTVRARCVQRIGESKCMSISVDIKKRKLALFQVKRIMPQKLMTPSGLLDIMPCCMESAMQ
jgi:hypothetical protein